MLMPSEQEADRGDAAGTVWTGWDNSRAGPIEDNRRHQSRKHRNDNHSRCNRVVGSESRPYQFHACLRSRRFAPGRVLATLLPGRLPATRETAVRSAVN